jgi:hypothetical protein
MYRYRRNKRLQRRRRATIVAGFAAALALVVGIPALASADRVGNILNNVGVSGGSTSGSGGGGGGTVTPEAGVPPT